MIYEPGGDDSVIPCLDRVATDDVTIPNGERDFARNDITISEDDDEVRKYYVNNIPVSVASERVQYYRKDGKLITESLKKYSKSNIISEYRSLDGFIKKWNEAEKKEELFKEMAENGIFIEALREEVGTDFDAFDLVCHVAFDMPPLTRRERADNVKKRNYFAKYGEKANKVIDGLLDKYVQNGITSIENTSVLKLNPLRDMGTPVELVKAFGKREDYENAV